MRYNLIMTAQGLSSELKEQVVLEVVEKDRTIAEVARSYGLVPQTVGNWVKKWRKDHPESVDSEVGAEQSAENRRLRAELREARMEIELREKRLPSSRRSPGNHPVRVHPPRRRKLPDHHDVPMSESVSIRLLRLAGPGAIKNRATQERAQRLDRVGPQQLPRHPVGTAVLTPPGPAGALRRARRRCAPARALPGPARPHSHAERSAPPSPPRTWARAPTWSGGTSPPTGRE